MYTYNVFFCVSSITDTAITCFDVLCRMQEKDNADVEKLNGVFRLMNVVNLRAFTQCTECKKTVHAISSSAKTATCTNCNTVCNLVQNQFAATVKALQFIIL